MRACILAICSLSFVRRIICLGAGRGCERDNPREREVVAALRSPLSLRFSLSRSPFPHSLLSMCAPQSLPVLWGSVVLIAFAVRARLRMLPMHSVFTIHHSFFTIQHSLDPLGAVTYEKPRLAACAANVGRVTLPHSGGKCQRGLPARREMEAGTARCQRGLPARIQIPQNRYS